MGKELLAQARRAREQRQSAEEQEALGKAMDCWRSVAAQNTVPSDLLYSIQEASERLRELSTEPSVKRALLVERVDLFSNLVRRYPELTNGHWFLGASGSDLGQLLIEAKEWEPAREALQIAHSACSHALQEHPDQLGPRHNLGCVWALLIECDVWQKQHEAAREHIEQALDHGRALVRDFPQEIVAKERLVETLAFLLIGSLVARVSLEEQRRAVDEVRSLIPPEPAQGSVMASLARRIFSEQASRARAEAILAQRGLHFFEANAWMGLKILEEIRGLSDPMMRHARALGALKLLHNGGHGCREQGRDREADACFAWAEEAIAFLVAEAKVDSQSRIWIVDTLGELGLGLEARGQREQALAYFLRAIEQVDQIAPIDQPEPQGNVWDSAAFWCEHASECAMAIGQFDQARGAALRLIDFRERSARLFPSEPRWTRKLGDAHSFLGDVHKESGDLSAAAATYLRSNEFFSAFAALPSAEAPERSCPRLALYLPKALRAWSVNCERLGDCSRARGDLDAAEAHYREGVGLCQKLLDQGASLPDLIAGYHRLLGRLQGIGRG